jgi:DNA-binding CsgD family transcriptional regulator
MKPTNSLKRYFYFFILFFSYFLSQAQEKIISNGDDWYYYDGGSLKTNWYQSSLNTTWKTGKTPLGYGDRKVATNILFGNDENNKDITKYFRKDIFISNDNYVAYEFKIMHDDGFILYINGKELYRGNMPNGTVTSETLAITTIQGREEAEFKIKIFETDIFKKGKNTISVSIHQNRVTSSDCLFSLDLIAHTNPEILALLLEKKNQKNKELQHEITKLNTSFKIDKINIQNDNLTNTNYSLKFLLFIVSFLLVIALIGYYFLINSLRSKESKSSNELTALKNAVLEKEKEMMIVSTNLLHNKQYFKEIKADLKGIKTEDKTTIRSIVNQIDLVLERDEEWAHLKKHFNTVFEGFYDILLERHSSLTETELRHSMFIKLHMQTKEISRILLIDPRSVQTARYRIKKKMNLKEEQDLREYLLSI